MAIESMLVAAEKFASASDQNPIRFADRLQLRSDPQAIQPVAMDGQDPRHGVFSQMVQPQPKSISNPNAGFPAPMQEATKAGGVLSIADARQLGAVLERFQQSQQERWSQVIQKVKTNPNNDLSSSLTRQLEMKMDSINRQFGNINKSLNLPLTAGANPKDYAFIESLGVTTDQLSKPIATFFNFIARGERQLYGIQAELDGIYRQGEMVSPVSLLKLQLKMTHVSQQLELFTSMLNKGLESSKTVLNTQI